MSVFVAGNKEAKALYVNHGGAVKEALSAYASLNGNIVKVYEKKKSSGNIINSYDLCCVQKIEGSVSSQVATGCYSKLNIYTDGVKSIKVNSNAPSDTTYPNYIAYKFNLFLAQKENYSVTSTTVSGYLTATKNGKTTTISTYSQNVTSSGTQITLGTLLQEHLDQINLSNYDYITLYIQQPNYKGYDLWEWIGLTIETEDNAGLHIKYEIKSESYASSSEESYIKHRIYPNDEANFNIKCTGSLYAGSSSTYNSSVSNYIRFQGINDIPYRSASVKAGESRKSYTIEDNMNFSYTNPFRTDIVCVQNSSKAYLEATADIVLSVN